MERRIRHEMLTLAREAKGWSQSDLAAAIDVTQAKISKMENGMLAIHADELSEICKALGYTEELFYQTTEISGLESSYLFHRKRNTTTIGTQKRVQASVNILRMQVERLMRGVELQFDKSFDAVAPDDSEPDVRKIAQMVRAAWRVPIGPIQNLTSLIESAGGIVMKVDFGTPKIDAAHLRPIGMRPLFFLNKDLAGDRLRWSLAHELGHAFLHTDNIGLDIEEEADTFAGEFLMPGREIKHQLHELTLERAAALKPIWKVSMASLIRQAHNNKCITDWKYRSLCIALSQRGFRKVEPFPVAIEEPTLLRDMVAIHRNQLGYDSFELAKLLYLNDPNFFDDRSRPRLMRIDGKPFFAFSAAG